MPRRTSTAAQLTLFGAPEPADKNAPKLAAVDPELEALAEGLPPGLHMGTSTWSFPGWVGFLWAREYPKTRIAREGLVAYSGHPLLRGVGLDRTYYQPLPAEDYADYAAQVPEGFRFVVKAHEALTVSVWPEHDRYGNRRGQTNPLFLDAAYAVEEVVGPMLEGLGDKAGALVFQFAPQDLGAPLDFIERLFHFLEALPREGRYAVEIRNRQVLRPQYALALADAGASHCFTVHPRMPPLRVQWEKTSGVAWAPEAPLVLRWMLRPGQTYDGARRRYEPFNQLVDPDPDNRRAVAELIRRATDSGREAFVTVNNKAEGSAPLTIFELAREIGRRGTPRD
jgi:uncharacterized protein YecE (DUF72 family)